MISSNEFLEKWSSSPSSSTRDVDAMPRFPLPSQQSLPPRCVSDQVDYHSQTSQGDDLIEDWPKRRTSYESGDAADWQALCARLHANQKAVVFSEYSSLHVYNEDLRYQMNKSYSSSERKQFGKEAVLESHRIKSLVTHFPIQGNSIRYLLSHNIISREEILGIEHMVSNRAATRIFRERRDHSARVLMEQQKMKERKELDDPSGKLAVVALTRSLRSVKRARFRAALAA